MQGAATSTASRASVSATSSSPRAAWTGASTQPRPELVHDVVVGADPRPSSAMASARSRLPEEQLHMSEIDEGGRAAGILAHLLEDLDSPPSLSARPRRGRRPRSRSGPGTRRCRRRRKRLRPRRKKSPRLRIALPALVEFAPQLRGHSRNCRRSSLLPASPSVAASQLVAQRQRRPCRSRAERPAETWYVAASNSSDHPRRGGRATAPSAKTARSEQRQPPSSFAASALRCQARASQ